MAWPRAVKKIECGIGASSWSFSIRNGVYRAGRRVVAALPGRHRPGVELRAVLRHRHALRRLVDLDENVGRGRKDRKQDKNTDSRECRRRRTKKTHDQNLSRPRDAAGKSLA